jgi:hypothetical protein
MHVQRVPHEIKSHTHQDRREVSKLAKERYLREIDDVFAVRRKG